MSKCKQEQCSPSKHQNDEQVLLHSGELVFRLVHAFCWLVWECPGSDLIHLNFLTLRYK